MTIKGILIVVVAVVWGSVSGQFLVQVVTSLVIAFIYLAAAVFSKLSKVMNLTGALTCVMQSLMYGSLFVGGNWLANKYIVSFDKWNAASIAALFSFVVTIIYVFPQVPGKIGLARMCAWVPHFMEAQMREPRGERVAFARKWRANRDFR
jgi:hypothetical protein